MGPSTKLSCVEGGFLAFPGRKNWRLQWPPEVGKVTFKSNGNEALSDESLLKSNGEEGLNDDLS